MKFFLFSRVSEISSALELFATASLLCMIYLLVYNFNMPALGKSHRSTVLPTSSSWAHPKSPWRPLLPIECPSPGWECSRAVPVSHCSEPFLPPGPWQASQPLSFRTLLAFATNRNAWACSPKSKIYHKGAGLLHALQGLRSCWASKTGIADYQVPLLLLMGFIFFYVYEIFSSTGSTWKTNKQTSQNQCKRKGSKHDSEQSVTYIGSNAGIPSFQTSALWRKTALWPSSHHNGCPCPNSCKNSHHLFVHVEGEKQFL